jgi:hypothetical protein
MEIPPLIACRDMRPQAFAANALVREESVRFREGRRDYLSEPLERMRFEVKEITSINVPPSLG